MEICLLINNKKIDQNNKEFYQNYKSIYVDHPDCNSIEKVIKYYYNNNIHQVPPFIKSFYDECKKKDNVS